MDAATARARLAAARVARLATVTPDGRPHVVPCCFALVDDTVVSAVDDVKAKSSRTLQRVANLRATPVATLVVDHYDDDWSTLWWVRVDGAARVLDAGPDREVALDALVAKYPQYAVARPPGVVIALDVARWASWP
jgi:PPOX class probable F420-dependent enzyme